MDEVWKHTPNDILERIAHFADIDSRRGMGFLPRKLPPSDLNIRLGKTRWYRGRPFTEVNLDSFYYTRLVSTEDGRIGWCFDMRRYEHMRPS